MANMFKTLSGIFQPVARLIPGIYHYISPPDDSRNFRLHLRIESSGEGVLIINAATILHLNQTAVEYAYGLVKNIPTEEIINTVVSRYRVRCEQVKNDYQDFLERINTLLSTPDLDPVTYLDFDHKTAFTGDITAPYRLDCALTYRLPSQTGADTEPVKRVSRELTTQEWISILDKAWQAGIPHIVFTGGEPTLRDDLIELISQAEANGQVCGLLTDGLRLSEQPFLEQIIQTGLDHLVVILQSENEDSWNALRCILDKDIFTSVHWTLTAENIHTIHSVIERLAQMKIGALSLSAINNDLYPQLQEARELTAQLDIPLIWDLPVPYSAHNPVMLEVSGDQLIEDAGRAWLYIEPDGDVLPTQGFNRVLGNLLNDPWEKVWQART